MLVALGLTAAGEAYSPANAAAKKEKGQEKEENLKFEELRFVG